MTNRPLISIIAALSENRVIGNENKLLWHIPEDMKRFRSLTSGHPIIMGRKTFESIGRPLPNRTNIIITRDNKFEAPGCLITHSLEEAIEKAKASTRLQLPSQSDGGQASSVNTNEIFIIGGAQIYNQALPFTNKLYLTIIHKPFTGDAIFPNYEEFKSIQFNEKHLDATLPFTFLDLTR